MKAYTNLEQSKKLAEILPLESADGFYATDDNIIIPEPYITYLNGERNIPAYKGAIPCWSLSALLIVLPQGTRLLKSATDEMYHCDCPKGNIDKWFDSPIDAAFEMILKLHELKML